MEIKSNNLTLYNIDAMFQKESRLKAMSEYDEKAIQQIISQKVSYILLTGENLSGKTTVANTITKNMTGFKHIDFKAIEEAVKKSKGTEEEPFEGEVLPEEVYAGVLKQIEADQKNGLQVKYLIETDPSKLEALANSFSQSS